MASKPAPGGLATVQELVNTLDVESGADALASPATLGEWLVARRLLPPTARVDREGLRRARELREALRELLSQNAGAPLDVRSVEVLNVAAARGRLTVRFAAHGASSVQPAAGGLDGALGRILAIVAEAMSAGTWSRLKACGANTCRYAFYDSTRNRSGVWCDMAVCGNRTKVRAYRRRREA